MKSTKKDIEIGEDHYSASKYTPIREDAFKLSDQEKIEKISKNFKEIMETLGLDLNDESLNGTPERVAKMYINEVFSGLNPKNTPSASLFENNYTYKGMLVEKDIEVYSYCEHHFVPIIGVAHVAYLAKDHVIGLSKINRIVQHYAKRPQVQERLTVQIVEHLKEVLGTEDVACVIDAKHLCVAMRGVNDTKSTTITAEYHGVFKKEEFKNEFLTHIQLPKNQI